MNTISIVRILHEFKQPQNTEITVYGWIRTKRCSKTKITFLNLYDGSCLQSLQVIAKNSLYNYSKDILKLTTGCSIMVRGYITNSTGSKQDIELIATHIQVLGWINQPSTYPITAKKHSMEYLRNVAHLRPRTHIFGAIARIRHVLCQSIHNLMNKKGFIWIPTPIITASDTEGNSKMFYVSELLDNPYKLQHTIDTNKTIPKLFFGKEAFLTVSGQLNAESYACALTKVYTFGPTFRAEHSNTNRHLAEFWMLEPEIAFADLHTIIKIADSLLKEIVQIILTECIHDIEYCASRIKEYNLIKRLEDFLNSKIIHIEYTDIINLLNSCNKQFNNSIYWGMDLFTEHEKYLSEEYFQAPIVIINHPKNIKAFYMRLNDDNKTVASMDILIPGIGEIIGGSQREERLSQLEKRFLENNLKKEHYWWYLDLRRYGTVPHSGFGLGFERLIIYITGLTNIRDAVPFPRTVNNINF